MSLMVFAEGLLLPPITASKYAATTFIFVPTAISSAKRMKRHKRSELCYGCLKKLKISRVFSLGFWIMGSRALIGFRVIFLDGPFYGPRNMTGFFQF